MSASRINVLWVIDHVCYDGNLHGGGRLYWNVLPKFDQQRFNIIPCMLRASDEIRAVFATSPVRPRILDKGKFDPTTLVTFLRLIKREKIDVMHLHCYGASTFGRLAGALTGVPSIIHDYDTAVYFPYPSYLALADRLLSPYTRRAVAASPMVRDYFVSRRRVSPEKISIALHAIPDEKFSLASAETAAKHRDELNIDRTAPVVTTVTKLGPQRGNRFLIKAAAATIAALPNAVFLLAYVPTRYHRKPSEGYINLSNDEDESNVEELVKLANRLNVRDSIRFIEITNNADELICAGDVFATPFLSPRFSSVPLLEAMAMGKPVLATDVGEAREIVTNGRDGFLCPVDDECEFAGRLVDLLQTPGRLQEFSRNAVETARGYSVESYARRLEKWYEDLTETNDQTA